MKKMDLIVGHFFAISNTTRQLRQFKPIHLNNRIVISHLNVLVNTSSVNVPRQSKPPLIPQSLKARRSVTKHQLVVT